MTEEQPNLSNGRSSETADHHLARFLQNMPSAGEDGPSLASPVGDDPSESSGRGADMVDPRVHELLLGHPGSRWGGMPNSLGRYVVMGELGSGGMGTVFEAFDPQLERRVALKVLHISTGQQHRSRLLREAQALAKLSHPNVVQVHEVGQEQGRLFIAMELVTGETLLRWHHRRPSWRECVEVYLQAGAGLAAAHAAGLTHRDFKPGNCILDDEGRARVLDFGLVSGSTLEPREPSSVESVEIDEGISSGIDALTRTGTVLGTPAYMPLEQLQGRAADARSDGFSFCVSLYEALYGERPFAAESFEELVTDLEQGRVGLPPPGSRVPASLRRALLRGLAPDPDERWADMTELLGELRRIARPRWRSWTVGVSLAGAVAAGAAGLWYYTLVGRLCDGIERHLDGVWDDARRSEVQAAILGTDVPYAASAWRQAEDSLDEYREGWIAMQTEACEATNVHGEQPPEVLGLRARCLRGHRVALEAVVDGLSVTDDPRVAENAVRAVGELPDLARCADVPELRAELPFPGDSEANAKAWTIRRRMAGVASDIELARYDEALAEIDEVVAEAEGLGHAPLVVEALWLRGKARGTQGELDAAEQDLQQAYLGGLRHGRDRVAAESAGALSSLVGSTRMRFGEGLQWGRTALALAQRLDYDPLVVEAAGVLARGLSRSGRLEAGLEQYQAAWSHHVQTYPSRRMPPHAIAVLVGMGEVLIELDHLDRALVELHQGLRAAEYTYGKEHPVVMDFLDGMGRALLEQSHIAEAAAHVEMARSIGEGLLDPRDPRLIGIEVDLCRCAGLEGRLDDALVSCRDALRRAEQSLGASHVTTAEVRSWHGWILRLRGDAEGAAVEQRAALELAESALGSDHPIVMRILLQLSATEVERGHPEVALAHSQRAVAISQRIHGSEHSTVGLGLARWADALLALDDSGSARSTYERAREVLVQTRGAEHPDAIRATLGLARAEAQIGQRAHAAQLVRDAVEVLESIEAPPTLLFDARALLDEVQTDREGALP